MKICKRCGVAKPCTAFSREPRARDGHRSVCKVCDSERRAAWRAANPDKVRAEAQRRKDYRREWGRANPDKIREYRRRAAAKAGERDFLTQWRKANAA